MKFISQLTGKPYWRIPENDKARKEKRKRDKILISVRDVYKAVAKEMICMNDYSADTIDSAILCYFEQLKKDGRFCYHDSTPESRVKEVHKFIDKEKQCI